MSRIGSMPVIVPPNVSVNIMKEAIVLSAISSDLSFCHKIPNFVECSFSEGVIKFFLAKDIAKKGRQYKNVLASWGMLRNMVRNSVEGLSGNVFSVDVNLVGVGYRVALDKTSRFLIFGLGYSHDVAFEIPNGVSVKCVKPTLIQLTSHDKCLVSQVVSRIENLRSVEPYKGKGIYRSGKYILRKSGKKK